MLGRLVPTAVPYVSTMARALPKKIAYMLSDIHFAWQLTDLASSKGATQEPGVFDRP